MTHPVSRIAALTVTLLVALLSSFGAGGLEAREPSGGSPAPTGSGAGSPNPTARDTTLRSYAIEPVEGASPRVDGRLDDAAWTDASFTSGFVQQEPTEGRPASGETRVALRYDEENLYLMARMRLDSSDGIRRQMTRRDEAGTSARLYLHLDPELDRRTARVFGVTAAGVRLDYALSSDQNEAHDRDYTYDPVWDAEVRVDSTAWTVEARIPFSELRLSGRARSTWGLQLQRVLPSRNEEDHWQLVPRTREGWISRFGRLTGIRGIDRSRTAEIRPYVATRGEVRGQLSSDNPLRSNPASRLRAGGDLTAGIGSGLTLDATVNPDFGQVEADPARVNLSAYELFFQENRPFFTEGSQYLHGGGPDYFYSRRIGAPPHGRARARYVEAPGNTTILGAGKLTGRVDGDLSVGALAAVTQEEQARATDSIGGEVRSVTVEPRTAYGVGRVEEQLAGGSSAGLSLTGVRRDMDPGSALTGDLPRSAVAGGGDWNLLFGDGRYQLRGFGGMSHVRGTSDAILDLQRSSVRYFQRQGADHVEVDSSRTSLTGWTAGLGLRKRSGEHWLWNVDAEASSPGFAINELGRLRRTDALSTGGGLTYRETDPGPLFRSWQVEMRTHHEWNFGGARQFSAVSPTASVEWPNFMRTSLFLFRQFGGTDERLTRGGPPVAGTDAWGGRLGWRTNPRSPNQLDGYLYYRREELGGWSGTVSGGASVRPSPDLRLEFSPRLTVSEEPRQYVTTLPDGPEATGGRRYVFSRIDRTTLSGELRADYAFSPDLSLELFAQPFAASGDYYEFGELARPGDRRLRRYGEGDSRIVGREDGTLRVEQGGERFTVPEPDFNLFSFRSTAVLRWQWRPGSTVYLAWQQDRRERRGIGTAVGPGGWIEPFDATGNQAVTAKMTYWLQL